LHVVKPHCDVAHVMPFAFFTVVLQSVVQLPQCCVLLVRSVSQPVLPVTQ
jgi:hypothetical protein